MSVPDKRRVRAYSAAMSSAASSLHVVAVALQDAIRPDPSDPGPTQLVAIVAGYVGFVADYPDDHARLIEASFGPQVEAMAVVEGIRTTLTETVVATLDLDYVRPPLLLAIRGWVASLEALTLDWTHHSPVNHAEFSALLRRLVASLIRAVEMSAAMDPASRRTYVPSANGGFDRSSASASR